MIKMLKHPIDVDYISYVWLLDESGNPVTGATAQLTCKVIDEADGVFASPVVTEVDSVNAPGLYKTTFTPDAIGFWKVYWDSAKAGANISGGEVIYVYDSVVESSDTLSYPDGTTEEIVFSSEVTTYRRITGSLDLCNLTAAKVMTVRIYEKTDGTNYRRVDSKEFTINATPANTTMPKFEYLTRQHTKITVQEDAGEGSAKNIPWHRSEERIY